MQRKFITLRSNEFNDGIDLELPGDQSISSLIPDLLKVLNWPATSNNTDLVYSLKIEDQELNQDLSLNQIGTENFQTVWITPPSLSNTVTKELHDKTNQPVIDNSLPFWDRITITEPCLVSFKGLVFVLGKTTTLIGRNDVGNSVDIDLTELEEDQFISSRKHAEIIKTDQGYLLRPFRTTNGTLLNGNELTAGETFLLENSNKIQFGFRGVQLVYKLPG
jgi:hypothetical protein